MPRTKGKGAPGRGARGAADRREEAERPLLRAAQRRFGLGGGPVVGGVGHGEAHEAFVRVAVGVAGAGTPERDDPAVHPGGDTACPISTG